MGLRKVIDVSAHMGSRRNTAIRRKVYPRIPQDPLELYMYKQINNKFLSYDR